MAESIVNGNASGCQRATPRALKVLGSSMLPQFQDGDIVVIDPRVQPVAGDFVVALVDGLDTRELEIFRMYRPLKGRRRKGRADAFELVALNQGVRPLRSDVCPLRIVGTVVERRRRFALRDVDGAGPFETDREEGGSTPWPSARTRPHEDRSMADARQSAAYEALLEAAITIGQH